MRRYLALLVTLVVLSPLAALSLTWAGHHALAKSDDLMLRRDEVRAFVAREDPYQVPSLTYPPSALPVFTPLVAPFGAEALKTFWLGLNLITLAVLCGAAVQLWGEGWPAWLKLAFVLAVVACRPVRGGIGLGQFHLIPTALILLSALLIRRGRPATAGVLVGIALAKPTMALPWLGVLAAQARWRAVAGALAVQAAATALTSIWLGIGPLTLTREWVALARGQLDAGSIDLPSLLQPLWPGTTSATLSTLLVLVLAAAVILAARRRSDRALVGFACFVAAIFTYHRHYDLVLLVPAFASTTALAWEARGRLAPVRWLIALAFALILIAPSHPAVLGRYTSWHEVAFPPLAYGLLALTVVDLLATPAESEDRADPSSPRAVSGGSKMPHRSAPSSPATVG